MTQPRLGVVHPRLGFGGSEAAALWAIEALKRDFSVSLITSGKVDLERLNDYYGTSLQTGEFSILEVPLPPGLRGTARFAGLRGAFVQRFCRRLAPRFDLMINTYNVCDYGAPTIQLIADFGFVEDWRFTMNPPLRGWRTWWYGKTPIRKGYLLLCRAIAGKTAESWKQNLTLANSRWSAQLMRERFGVQGEVLYPPVADGFSDVPYADRENGFVCIGSIVPEKRMDAIIGILQKVHHDGYDVHLHILGSIDDSPYGKRIKELISKNRDWVFTEGRVFGQRKKELMARHRFGINARENEPFGIVVAEMVKAGCIVFVPNGGGQTEIADHPALIYESDGDAVRKIEAVLADSTLAAILRTHLAEGANRFSVEGFMRGIRKIVIEFLQEKKIAREANH